MYGVNTVLQASKALEKSMRASRKKRWTSFKKSSTSSRDSGHDPSALHSPSGAVHGARGSAATSPTRIGKLSQTKSSNKSAGSAKARLSTKVQQDAEVARRVGSLAGSAIVPDTNIDPPGDHQGGLAPKVEIDTNVRASQPSKGGQKTGMDDVSILLNDLPIPAEESPPKVVAVSGRNASTENALLNDTQCIVNDMSTVKKPATKVPVGVLPDKANRWNGLNQPNFELMEVTSETLM